MEGAFLRETPPLTATNAAKLSAPPSLSPSDLRQLDPYGGKREEKKKRKCVWLVSGCLPPAVTHHPGNCTQSGPAPGGHIL